MNSKLTTYENGTKVWILPSGDFHKEDGPAVITAIGTKNWYLNGKLHREDAPAIEWGNGDKWWFLNGIKYTEQEHKYEMRSRKLTKLLK